MSVIDDVKTRLDIVDDRRQLRAPGRRRGAKGAVSVPSRAHAFVLRLPDRQSWHCFGACGTGGDVISFVSKKENLDFQATLRMLADRAGVELRSDGPRREQTKTLLDANEAAAVYFHGMLQNARRPAPI